MVGLPNAQGPPTHRLIVLSWRMWANINTRVKFSAARPDYLFPTLLILATFAMLFALNHLIYSFPSLVSISLPARTCLSCGLLLRCCFALTFRFGWRFSA